MKGVKSKTQKALVYSAEKDCQIKELIKLVATSGVEVRREKLKQGYGWKVMSGNCRLEQQKLIFVDQKLPQNEQIDFLVHKIQSLNIKPAPELLEKFSPLLRAQICGTQAAA